MSPVVIRRLLAVPLLAGAATLGAVVAPAGPAAASCPVERASVAQHAAAADDVFSGTIAKRSRTGHTMTLTVEVDRVWKGSVSTARLSVTTDTRVRACGQPDLARGSAYVFFTREDSGRLATDRRTGTDAATEDYVARVVRSLGEGRPAVAPTPEPAEVAFTRVAGPRDDVTRLAAPGAALVLVGLLGLGLASWRGRRRAG